MIYNPIVEKCKSGIEKKKLKKSLDSPSNKKRINIKVHENSDVKVLWNISNDVDLLKDVCNCVVDCEVVDTWYEKFDKLKEFIDVNKKRPSCKSKNKEEKQLGNWVSTQTQNYKNIKYSMKEQNKYNI